MKNLFEKESRKIILNKDDVYTGFYTPLGNICLCAEVNKKRIDLLNVHEVFKVEGGLLFKWINKSYNIELLLVEEEIKIPQGMRVNECWSGRWRIEALEDIDSLNFNCRWEENYIWTNGGPDGGEWFDAKTWLNDEYMVTVLTEDAYKLELRANENQWMPKRLEGCFIEEFENHKFDYHIEYDKEMCKVIIPNLKYDEVCQINYSMAWTKYISNDDASTWYAADIFQ
ncbi:hypothetical protein [Anaeromicrobium sediminis]|uniref:Uncharacterized protein n=1 Tax=Anaeromicrobium sediminis TaxID=1478221 RepID=A0A267ML61_9FIRM|nr:hypothetical protein [Anaeromicrobium sediminis]PAB60344.1 hypothetical protein CCE28_05465 [Anaeromicrobium sediminis]